jgi:hypothetical protein
LIDEKEVARILNWDNRTRQSANVFSVYIHHNRKENGERRPSRLSDVYGSYLFGARFDYVVCLWKDPGKYGNPALSEGTKLVELKTRYGQEEIIDVERNKFLHWERKTVTSPEEKKEEDAVTPAATGSIVDMNGL